MKLNWKANWEIFLVLVIIVVGIVITTIATIRNKDTKHALLALAEDSDSFNSHTFAGGSPDLASNGADYPHHQNQADLFADLDHRSTRRPQPGAHQPVTRAAGRSQLPARSLHHHNSSDLYRNHQMMTTVKPMIAPNSGLYPNDDYNQQQILVASQQQATTEPMQINVRDSYETSAASTEPTIITSQMGASNDYSPANHRLRHTSGGPKGPQIRARPRQMTTSTTPSSSDGGEFGMVDSGQPQMDADQAADPMTNDIHTTRSTLANSRDSYGPSSDDLAAPFQGQMQAPYGIVRNSLRTNGDTQTDEMMTSYSKTPSNQTDTSQQQSISPAMLTNLLANLHGSGSNDIQEQLTGLPPSLPNLRGLSSPLPISVLLGDLLKLSRVQHMSSLQPSEPVNQRQPPPPGILQQLRSLPGPLLSLLQSPAGDALNGSPSHDASESNQHYHRISMGQPTDIKAILARSLRASNILPGFPAPKGTPQNWVNPTSGGDPEYHSTMNSKADFVANNAAGFLPISMQQQQQTSNDATNVQAASNPNVAENQISNETPQSMHQQQASIGIQQQQTQASRNQEQNPNWQQTNSYSPAIFQQQNLPLNLQAQAQIQQIRSQMAASAINQERPSISSGPVPLGYQQQPHQHQQQQQQSVIRAPSGDYSSESAPSGAVLASNPSQLLIRQRRAIGLASDEDVDDEDDFDAPVSIVGLDGRHIPRKQMRVNAMHHRWHKAELDEQSSNQLSTRAINKGFQVNPHPETKNRPVKSKMRPRKQQQSTRDKRKLNGPIDTASSGLVSKLLGASTTRDEFEDEFNDNDDDSNELANEKRKEELEDAEFGIVNPRSRFRESEKETPSSSKESESYANRANQQRSDIEFYGHPGEETRQLKYGILGSGNYEVVNGGVYPEAEESTAAVNSVANYVRKPAALLAKFAMANGQGAGPTPDGSEGFMPGGRMGGFMRGASGTPDGLIGLMPGERDLTNSLLEFIDVNGDKLVDANLLTQLGSSGSSAMSTHKDPSQDEDGLEDVRAYQKHKSTTKQKHRAASLPDKPAKSNSKKKIAAGGSHQLNSYQILPSNKKVTIFSEQDLDSAPSEVFEMHK